LLNSILKLVLMVSERMKIELPYGKDKTVIVDIPDKNVLFVADRGVAPPLKNPRDEIRRSLKKPIGTPSLRELVGLKDKVVIIGDDITRPTPQSIIVPVLLDELNAVGVPDENIQVIIALGTHREMSKKEIREKYGSEVVKRVPVVNHDFKDLKKSVDMGKTETGIPISVNKDVYNADFVMGVGNIVPHCLAGWAGGGKIIQPGICGEETKAMTHVTAAKVRPISKLMGRLSLAAKSKVEMGSTCTVFATQEMVAKLSEGVPLPDIIAGLHEAIAARIHSMVGRLKIEREVALTGGGAKNIGLVRALEAKLGFPVLLPPEPLLTGAIGAALLGKDVVKQAAESGTPLPRSERRLQEVTLFPP
jgi:hypothetical protein